MAFFVFLFYNYDEEICKEKKERDTIMVLIHNNFI